MIWHKKFAIIIRYTIFYCIRSINPFIAETKEMSPGSSATGATIVLLRALVIMLSLSAAGMTGCTLGEIAKIQSDGIDYYVDGDIEAYKEEIRNAYEKDPDDPYAMNNMGVVYELEGDIPKAKEMYKKAADNAGERGIRKSSREGDKDRSLKEIAEENLKRIEKFEEGS
jgi:tetratricopeptide (TPR) repeat protein